jgi:glycine cleavage system H protein
MSVPEDLRYSADHEWARREGSRIRIGVTDYAQDALGDVVYVQLPELGSAVTAGEAFGEVESTKSVSDLFAPVDGRVCAVNEALQDAPQSVNSAPYDAGWLCEIEMSDASQYEQLLSADAYRSLLEG